MQWRATRLEEVGGIDLSAARLAIGTSAGAVIAADLRCGRSFGEMVERVSADGESRGRIEAAWHTKPELLRRVVGSSWVMMRSGLPFAIRTPEPPPLFKRVFPGSLATIAPTTWDSRYPSAWPAGELWTVASDLDTGRRVVLSQQSVDQREVTVAMAVQASCAVPGLYAPVRTGGRRLVDGGVHSVTNLDLVVRTGCRVVIAVAPLGFDRRDPPNYLRAAPLRRFNAQLDREAARVRRADLGLDQDAQDLVGWPPLRFGGLTADRRQP